MWATCVGSNERDTQGCAIDDLVDQDDIALQRQSNSYFTQVVDIDHQDFCPELMDEVRVVGDFAVYKNEEFTARIDNDSDPNAAIPAHDKIVYTNDQLYYEATYRTASASVIASEGLDFKDNDEGSYGDASIIDHVRPTKIFMDVSLGEQRDGSATDAYDGWNGAADKWDSNLKWALGGSRIPGIDSEISGDDLVVTADGGADNTGGSAKYQILLCQVDEVNAQYIEDTLQKPALCFTQKKKIAVDYLDFTQVVRTQKPSTNDIEENEVAFNMRMDERILPVGPNSDNSFITVTIEAEVYYKGNRHPTRRLLQTDQPAGQRNQKHAMSVGYGIQHTARLDTCVVDNKQEEGMMKLSMAYSSEKDMPKAGDMTTFVSQLTMQLDSYHKVRGAVSVEKVERCTSLSCTMMYARGGKKSIRRRAEVEGAHLNVYVKFSSVDTNKAGYVMNIFQNNLSNPRSDMHKQVAMFETAKTAKLEVDGCNGANFGMKKGKTSRNDMDNLVDMLKEESSAARPTALLAL